MLPMKIVAYKITNQFADNQIIGYQQVFCNQTFSSKVINL